MKRLITCLTAILLLLMLAPARVGATDFYVQVNDGSRPYLYVWDANMKYFGVWPGSNDYIPVKDESGSIWFKFSKEITAGTSIQLIVNKGSGQTQSTDSKNYTIPTTQAVRVTWTGDGTAAPDVSDTDGANYSDLNYDIDAYYFVSPELTGGEILSRFKLIPSRERTFGTTVDNKGAISTTLFSLNLKDDEIEKLANKYTENSGVITDNTIHYYIAKGDGTMNYRPSSNNFELAQTGQNDNNTGHCNEGKNVVHNAVLSNGNSSTANVFILKYGQYSTKSGCTDKKLRSYTWLLNTESGYVSLCKNISLYQHDEDPKFYLIGNINNAEGGSANWDPINPQNRFLMTKNVYKNPDNTQETDSVVYTATIKRPKEGWADLYIGVAEEYLFKDESFSVWDWDNIIRPQVQWRDDNRNNGLDATALEGGLFIDGGTGDQNNNQSLNPNIYSLPNYEEIESFTFSMNVTTSTYRMIFNRGFYIIGEAASTETVSAGWLEDNAIKMDYDENAGCWTETVKMENGKHFRFYNDNTMTSCFIEDGNAPGVPNTEDELKGEDTQYVNQVKWYNEGKNEYDGTTMAERDIVFQLPTGEYTIRFYSKSIDGGANAGNDASRIYYTIERDFTLRKPTGTELNTVEGFSDKYLKAFSNYHAVNIPENVKAYIVSGASEKQGNEKYAKATVTELTTTYIPAQTGVLLTYDNTSSEITEDVHFTYYDDPFYNTDGGNAVTGNMLKPQVISIHIPANDAEGKYNYIFGYKKLNADDVKATLGFYIPGTGDCAANTSYLQTDFNTAGDSSGVNNAKGIILSFDTETTSITNVESEVSKGCYYTLQGIKVENLSKGIYIHNGKKVIIK